MPYFEQGYALIIGVANYAKVSKLSETILKDAFKLHDVVQAGKEHLMNFNEPQLGDHPGSDSDDEQDEGEKKAPVMYTCIHKNDPASCTLWDQHQRDPYYYPRVDAQTPCHFCGHRGTLRAVR